MSDDLLALLRYRIATRFYDQPQVVDRIARAILRGGHLETNAFSGV